MAIPSLPKDTNTAQSDGNSSASAGTRKCPFCAEYVKTEAIICRFCKKDLPPLPEPESASNIKNSININLPPDQTGSFSSEQIRVMEEFGISYDGEKFHFLEYRYEKLSDAVDYAKQQKEK